MSGNLYRVKLAVQSQNVFRHIVRRATDIGMVVNASKTTMCCVSDAQQYIADAYMYDDNDSRIECVDGFKALGMRFSNRLTLDKQVKAIQKNVRSRLWTLRNLKSHGFTEEELLKVYKTIIRPVMEYAACLLYTSPSPRDRQKSRMPSSA